MNKNELAYFAGFIDGDGCFNIQSFQRLRVKKGKSYQSEEYLCQISITNKFGILLKQFQEIFGGSFLRSSHITKHAPLYIYRVNITQKCGLLQSIKPYLIQRANQCHIAIQFKHSPPCKRKELINQMKTARQSNLVYPEFKKHALANRKTISYRDSDFPYIAGFIEAEGCFTINKKRSNNSTVFVPVLRIGDTTTPVIEWCIQRFGGNVFIQKRTGKDLADYHLTGSDLEFLLINILPYLKVKHAQAQILLDLIHHRKNRLHHMKAGYSEWAKGSKIVCGHYYQSIKKLNQKGL